MSFRTLLASVLSVSLGAAAFAGPTASKSTSPAPTGQFPKQPNKHVTVSPCSPHENGPGKPGAKPPAAKPGQGGHRG